VRGALLASALALAAASAAAQTASDPLEGFNRGVQRFNDGVDEAVLEPVAEGYRRLVPSFVRTGVANFFGNLGDGWSAVNHLLQGKPGDALDMTLRVAVNTTFGLGGLLDVASEAGIERRSEDFGQTLGVWGLPAGPYLVLPLLGPSSLRDAAGRPLDMAATSLGLVTDRDGTRAAGTVLSVVDTRASLLGATRLLDDIALDRYTFLRDAYLARRKNLVWDGNPPQERDDDPQ
jgi:phospholipid-binding lipoprotein MlaA